MSLEFRCAATAIGQSTHAALNRPFTRPLQVLF